MKRRSFAAIVLAAVFAGGISAGEHADAQSLVTAKPAKIIYVNVGQGDGVVMRIGGKIIVSDTGEQFPEHMDEALHALKAKQIDVAILSHAHEDHVKNTIRLIRDFGWTIKLVVLSDSAWWEGTDTNRELMNLLEEKKVPRVIATRGQTFDWGGATWRILNPPVHEFTGGASQAANASIAYLLTVNGVQALFTGDVEPKVGRQIAVEIKPLLPRPVDIFLATHHGSKFGSVSELLAAIHPHWAVISAGLHNAFDHPAVETVARLKASGASIWCTDTNGSITARISAAGRLSWRTSAQPAPWWSGRDQHENGTCNGR